MKICGVTISNPDKELYTEPSVTKGEVAQYYQKIASRMLPYIRRRILSLVVCPRGIKDPCFYKKHPTDGTYCYIANVAELIAAVQNNTLEFHVWGSTIRNIDKPDIMVFDLDPDEKLSLKDVRRGVLDLNSILDELGLVSFLKTSGNKGYHVVVPLKTTPNWESFHSFAKRVAEVIVAKWPNRYTSNVRKENRKGKIFIDYLRNGKGATSIAPYSIRAKQGARVSMPIAWEELDNVAPNGITMAEAVARLSTPDPWAGFFAVMRRQGIKSGAPASLARAHHE